MKRIRSDRLLPIVVAWIIVAGAFWLGVEAAHAAPEPESESPSTAVALDFPILRGAEAVAEEYWASRGVALPPLEGVFELPTDGSWAGVGGFADLAGGRIWLSVGELEALRSPLRQFSIRSRAELCYLVIHERGHNAGLLHTDAAVFPIMAMRNEVEGGGWLRKEVAPHCWAWAKHPFG